jgi:hypothetical protein
MKSAIPATLLLVFAGPVAAADQFDLICKGTLETSSVTGDQTKPFETHLRIDLQLGKYCEQACRAHFDIASIHPGALLLTDKRVDAPSEDSFTRVEINRSTGDYRGASGWRVPNRPELTVSLKYTGTCEAQAFSGFPALETRF